MKQENIFTKCSICILIVSFLVLANEFIQLIPTHSTRLKSFLLYYEPSIFEIIGGILSIVGFTNFYLGIIEIHKCNIYVKI
ncbi:MULTISPECIES: hypothetical protein [Clostridium]|uniref:hypothetical protein n=1 Tax=Clostridium TaxID=1485 RepID=UPI000B3FD434|nr:MULTISPECIES: hypothetical protein [Clostridium]OVE69024.1 hypothetical protein CCS79_08845 [Clostridium diolis]